MYLISILYAREKKSKNFFYIERYGNDLHRPTSFFFIAWRKEASPTRNRNIYNYCCMSISILHKLSLLFLLVLPPFQKRPSPTVTKKVQKSQKTGKKRRQCRKGNTQKNFRFLGKVCKRPTSTDIRPPSKRCKKARKTGRM